MKELSNAEKAIAYDQIIKKANKMHHENCETCQMCIEELIPELAESEDERIRESIIAILKNYVDNSNTFKPKMIAWLEKQKEGKFIDKNLVKEEAHRIAWECSKHYDPLLSRESWCEMAALDMAYWIEKQGEQKPVWGEKDEDNFKHLMDEIVCLGNSRNSANRLYYDRLIKFLDELKNRAQPKEKWCDKDERMLDRLIAYFEKQVAFTDDDNSRYANWLKSLKGRVQPISK